MSVSESERTNVLKICQGKKYFVTVSHCGLVPNHLWTGTGPRPGGWAPLSQIIKRILIINNEDSSEINIPLS